MFYSFIKFITRFSLLFFFRKRIVCGNALQELKGPAIIAANHPDSLMDAVVIGCCCRHPVHFTIRSDMFNNKLFNFLLSRLNGIPVYRLSEEKEKLRQNFASIEHCKQVLLNDGIIIIFAEGQTLHDWNLKPVKSGVSKIVRHAITDPALKETLTVVPVGLTYSDYNHPAKTIVIQTGESFHPGLIDKTLTDGIWKQTFNASLFKKMEPLVPGMQSLKKNNIEAWQIVIKSLKPQAAHNASKRLSSAGNIIERAEAIPDLSSVTRQYLIKSRNQFYSNLFLLFVCCIPAIAGLLLNAVYYFPTSRWARKKTRGSIFYDALLCGLITITYPLYVLITAVVLHYTTSIHFFVWILLLPVTGWCTVYAYPLLLEVKNFVMLRTDQKKFLNELM